MTVGPARSPWVKAATKLIAAWITAAAAAVPTPPSAGWATRLTCSGLEGWQVSYGVSALYAGATRRLGSVGLNAVWRWPWRPVAQGILRAGVASVHQSRKAENFRSAQATPGLGVAIPASPSVPVELAWDFVTSTGGSDRIGTVIAQPITLGLRVLF